MKKQKSTTKLMDWQKDIVQDQPEEKVKRAKDSRDYETMLLEFLSEEFGVV